MPLSGGDVCCSAILPGTWAAGGSSEYIKRRKRYEEKSDSNYVINDPAGIGGIRVRDGE